MDLKIIKTVVIILILVIAGICMDTKKAMRTTVIFKLDHAENNPLYLISDKVSETYTLQENNSNINFVQFHPDYFTCILNRDSIRLYIVPGDNITIEANLKSLRKSLKIKGSEACNYLLMKEQLSSQEDTKHHLNLLDTAIKDKNKYHDFLLAEYCKILRLHFKPDGFSDPVAQSQPNPGNYYSIYPDIHHKTSVHQML